MAQNPSFQKRQKEQARIEWQKEKDAKKKQRKAEKDERTKSGEVAPDDIVTLDPLTGALTSSGGSKP